MWCKNCGKIDRGLVCNPKRREPDKRKIICPYCKIAIGEWISGDPRGHSKWYFSQRDFEDNMARAEKRNHDGNMGLIDRLAHKIFH